MYESILFDMDGVLVDTESSQVAAEQQTCRDFGFDIGAIDWGEFKGRTAEDVFNFLINEFGDPEVHSVNEFVEHKTDILLGTLDGNLEPIEGSLDFLNWARNNHKQVGLVTSSNQRVQQFVTKAFGISEYFNTIVTGDDIEKGHGKPLPDPYLTALGNLGLKGGPKTLVVEDSKSGIQSAIAANCHVLAITTSYRQAELNHLNPTYIVNNYPLARSLIEVNRV
jgi:HAD superfamily hydrolase (TIGR01509 family)